MSSTLFPLFAVLLLSMCTSTRGTQISASAHENKDYTYVGLSKELLRAAQQKTDPTEIREELANVPMETLAQELDNDEAKKAFWINVYNANVQLILSENPELFDDRGKFFGEPRVTVAGKKLSFDDIEHGIIRGSRVKWLLGLVKDPFASKYERTFRVDKTDGRIHFALNCGAKSCPYIAIYDAPYMNAQLDEISKEFLNRTSTYKPEEDKVYVVALFSWFRGDFGGKSGAKKDYLKRYGVIPPEADPAIEFKDYDWTLELGNYTELETGTEAAVK